MLKIREIRKTYESKKGATVNALDGLSIDFPQKGLVFITGKSGCGKSTLLNVLGGLDTVNSGEIVIKGRSSKTFTPSDFDSYRNTYCGFIFQEYNLIDGKTVGENIGLALELQGKKADKDKIEEVLKTLELVDQNNGETFFSRFVNELSGGQKQRVSIARALIKDPEIILADEPTGALDSDSGIQLYEILKRLSKDKLIIVVTHDLENAEKYGERIIELKDGKIIRGAAPLASSDLTENPNEPCVFIKSKLPFKRIFAMGASGLKVKRVRLAMSIILSIMTFVIFGFSLTAAFVNVLNAELGQMYKSGQEFAVVYNNVKFIDESGSERTSIRKFTEDQIKEIIGYNGGKLPPLAYSRNYNLWTSIDVEMSYNLGISDYYNLHYFYGGYVGAAHTINGLIELNPETGMSDANLRPDERLLDKTKNRLPVNFNEIAITDMQADMFLQFGYVKQREDIAGDKIEDLDVIKINTPDDLIGKTIGKMKEGKFTSYPFTIVGVFSTENNRAALEETLKDNGMNKNFDYAEMTAAGVSTSLISHGFVKEGLRDYAIESGLAKPDAKLNGQSSFLIRLSGNKVKDNAFFKRLNVTESGQEYFADIATPFSDFVSTSEMYFRWLVLIGLVAVGIFSIFATLLMMNFLNASIDSKKLEMGILRAMGARKIELTLICLVESFLIMAIQLAIAAVITAILCTVLNNSVFFLQVLQFGISQVALLILLAFTVSTLATILPVLKITNKKPIDIINNK